MRKKILSPDPMHVIFMVLLCDEVPSAESVTKAF